jgi:hypothetical protein
MMMIFGSKSVARLALTWILLVMIPACQAQSTPNLDKHARKVYKRLNKYSAGTYLTLALRDGSDSSGVLKTVSESSFTLVDADNNQPETYLYGNVAKVERGKEYIGEGSEPRHHIRLWVPVVLGVVAAGAAVTALEVR